MERGLLVFGVLFLLLPLLALAGIPMLAATAGISAIFLVVVLLLLGFTVALPFVDLD